MLLFHWFKLFLFLFLYFYFIISINLLITFLTLFINVLCVGIPDAPDRKFNELPGDRPIRSRLISKKRGGVAPPPPPAHTHIDEG